MKILFSKTNFSADYKETLGFIDADISYTRIFPHLRTATADVIELIGEANYNDAFALTDDDFFKVQLKYVVALNSYMMYAPTADVAVTNNGRLMRRDEHTVSAFQWQIDANNDALQQQYYRQLDLLLGLMAKLNKNIVNPKYDYIDLLVPSLDAFENIFNIENSFYVYLKLIPALREFEIREAKPRMGVYFDKLKIAENTPLLLNLQSAAVFYALAWGFRRLNAQIFPKGILQTTITSTDKKAPSVSQYEIQARVFDKDCAKYLVTVEEWVKREMGLQKPVSSTDDFDFGFNFNDGFIDV